MTHTILSQHVNKCNTAAANVILSVLFLQEISVCPSALKNKKHKWKQNNTTQLTPATRASQTLFICYVSEWKPGWNFKDKLHLYTAAPQSTLPPSLVQAQQMWNAMESTYEGGQQKNSEHVFHPTQTSAPTRLLLQHLKQDYYFS